MSAAGLRRCHRYGKSLLIDTIACIAGSRASTLTVLDVACHCGLFTLELAERGFGQVTGLDLRERNVSHARFLADVEYSAEGETHYELHPTYRALCDAL